MSRHENDQPDPPHRNRGGVACAYRVLKAGRAGIPCRGWRVRLSLRRAPASYVGLWATAAEGCSDAAWRFEAARVSTQGEVSCEFQDIAMTDRGYDIQPNARQARAYNIQLSFAESARAMMISGGPWETGTALVFCSTLPTP
ncbi:MAG: hypothetical protein IPG56_09510 [Caulobacteraceae bacterium]|nr:hypothetical protein [Caulobacteraceae bacterium]